MTIDDILHGLTNGLKYSKERLLFIRFRLNEIRREYNLSLEELDNYCWLDSCTMFGIIFDYADFDREKFACA